MHDHRAIELAGQQRLFVAADVLAELRRVPLLLENRDRIAIGHARKRRNDFLQLAGVALENLEFLFARLQTALHDEADELLGQLMSPSRSMKATSGSTIQNSVRWRRVLLFSERKVGPNV